MLRSFKNVMSISKYKFAQISKSEMRSRSDCEFKMLIVLKLFLVY